MSQMNNNTHYSLSGSLFAGSQKLLENIDFTLTHGLWHCLLGESGAGKSSLLNYIADLKGAVTLEGSAHWLDRKGEKISTPPKLALMSQSDLLLAHKDIAQNIGLGADLRGEKVNEEKIAALIEQVDLKGHEHKTPSMLSGGMRQRVSLARCLYENADVVLLDEPFSKLDAHTRIAMQKLAAQLLKGKTVVHVTHDPREAAILAEKIYVLSHGKLNKIPPPNTPPPRAIDADEVTKFEIVLLEAF